jgi:hypothetical protein
LVNIPDKQKKVDFLEKAIAKIIINRRFVPYIQLHEFEGLLFSDAKGFLTIPDLPDKNLNILQDIILKHPNPELLNDGADTAPSKRLKKLIPSYRKPLYGTIIAEEIGMETILAKCPRFANWVKIMVEKMKIS